MHLAFLFPGQGSQSVGMLTPWLAHPIVLETFTEANDILKFDLLSLIQSGPAEKLNETAFTQPALLAMSVALWRLWESTTALRPAYMAGHSLGEYSALVCANALSFSDALRLVRRRGECMQNAVPEGVGAMAAVLGLKPALVRSICDEVASELADVVVAANFNSNEQTVISGKKAAVEKAGELMKEAGAKRVLPLPVSVPSHSPLMTEAAAAFAADLNAVPLQTPTIPVFNNVDVKCEQAPEAIRSALYRQLAEPVRWVEIVEALFQAEVGHAVECGPGKVLSGLVKRIVDGITCHTVADAAALGQVFESHKG